MEFYKKLKNKKIQCLACARNCQIEKDSVGYCGVRKNTSGDLEILNYGKLLFLKKKQNTMHVGSLGSNMRMSFEKNWDTSLYPFLRSKEVGREKTNEEVRRLGYTYTPKKLVEYSKKHGCDEIVFGYNEPLVGIEYVLEVCKEDIDVSIVTTGYFSQKSLDATIGSVRKVYFVFYSPFDKFYIKHCSAQLSKIKGNLEEIFNSKTELEIVCPVIEGENDVLSVCKFLKQFSLDIKINFVKFIPSYRMLDKSVTTEEKLKEAVEIAKGVGFKNVDFVT